MATETSAPPQRFPIWATLACGILLCVLGVVLVRTAWVSDDAFITFRTIDNVLHGYGLRWNAAERVQSFTHPLWLLVLVPVVRLTGNPYLSALGLSAMFTACAVALVLASLRRRPWQACLALAAMILSKAFTDYSTSGLENPLSHALLAGLMLVTVSPSTDRRRAAGLGLLVGLIGLTRMDLLLLAVPIALASLRSVRRTGPAFLLGATPLALWEIFSVIYYGVPFPNTAYAKIATGVPERELFAQGIVYLLDALQRDPLTIFVIASTTIAALWTRRSLVIVAAIGVYVAYLLRIGGDFMSTRFFSAPFVVSLALMGRVPPPSALVRLGYVAALLALGLTVSEPTLFSDSAYTTPWLKVTSGSGVIDERGFRFQQTGWLSSNGFRRWPDVEVLLTQIQRVKVAHPRAFTHDQVGMAGYHTGPDRQIVDVWALCDPLLARLPAKRPWRIGHYERDLPAGYLDSVIEDTNRIEDPRIASLYEVIRVVTRGPIWSWQRWRAIVALNRGQTDGWPVPSRAPAS